MSVKFVIRSSGRGWYLAPCMGYTEEIEKAYRYDASEIEFGDKDYVSLADGASQCKAAEVQIAPESVREMVGLAKEAANLDAIIKAGTEALEAATVGPGTTTEDWLNSLLSPPDEAPAEPEHEESTLESGQRIRHHTWMKCELPCPLHGPSPHPLNRADRYYNSTIKVMYRECRHDVQHPDPDDIQVREMPHLTIHSCCKEKCCEE